MDVCKQHLISVNTFQLLTKDLLNSPPWLSFDCVQLLLVYWCIYHVRIVNQATEKLQFKTKYQKVRAKANSLIMINYFLAIDNCSSAANAWIQFCWLDRVSFPRGGRDNINQLTYIPWNFCLRKTLHMKIFLPENLPWIKIFLDTEGWNAFRTLACLLVC